MKRRIVTARTHGVVAGQAFAEDEGRRLTVTTACKVAGARRFRYEVTLASSHDPETKCIHFEVDAPFDVTPPDLADAALLLSVFPALHHGGELAIKGTVSRRLARHVVELQAIWSMARPDLYRPFRLVADGIESEVRPVNERAIMPLTGGLDSMLTLCRHTDPARPLGPATERVEAALFLPGFAPRPDRRPEYGAATEAVRRIAALRGLPLAAAETNFCEVVRLVPFASATLLSGALTLFSSGFGRGLIGASVPYLHPFYRFYGSTPWIDPLCSSGAMSIRDDGTDMRRVEKAAAIGRYPEMLEHLIVCFDVEGLTGNCGRCEKCLRTMLSFLAVGAEMPRAFPQEIELDRIGRRLGFLSAWSFARHTLQAAAAMGIRHPALARLRSRYRVKRAKYEARKLLTRLVPPLDLLKRDAYVPLWLVARRARRGRRLPREPWYCPTA